MKHSAPIRFPIWIPIALAALIAAPAVADKPQVKTITSPDRIDWETPFQYRAATLTVSGPDGFRWEQVFGAGEKLALDLAALTAAASPSGQYKYELVLTPVMNAADQVLATEARELGQDVAFLSPKSVPRLTGEFALSDGALVDPGAAEPGTELKLLHAENVYIDGSLCVGNDCVNGAGFGFDTIRLQENNLRIKFDDTSVVPGFASNDWQIIVNSSSSGGPSYFAVQDTTASRQVFKIEAGAPENALYVESDGDIGVGTSNPAVDVHVITGNTPTLRLGQDGSSGFTPQVWDLAGNETNFFIRDATTGSRLPLRIRAGAATSSIDIDGSGNVRFNHANSALGRVHARANNTTEDIFVAEGASAGGPARFALINTSTGTGASGIRWIFNATNSELLNISDQEANGTPGNNGTEFSMDRSGNVTLTGMLTVCDGGAVCTETSLPDYVFDPDYELMPLADLHAYVTENRHLPNIPSADEMSGGINMTKLAIGLLEKVEELTLYTLQQQQMISEQQDTIGRLAGRLEALESD